MAILSISINAYEIFVTWLLSGLFNIRPKGADLIPGYLGAGQVSFFEIWVA
jgi:hypothetical protein